MSLQTIRAMERKMARKSRELGTLPYVVTPAVLAAWKARNAAGQTIRLPFPAIGTRRPRGWKLTEELFVDSSGFGSTSEPALTVGQLLDRLKVGMAYAITSAGQFQVYLGEFRPPRQVVEG